MNCWQLTLAQCDHVFFSFVYFLHIIIHRHWCLMFVDQLSNIIHILSGFKDSMYFVSSNSKDTFILNNVLLRIKYLSNLDREKDENFMFGSSFRSLHCFKLNSFLPSALIIKIVYSIAWWPFWIFMQSLTR